MWRDLYVYQKSTKPLSPVEIATDKAALFFESFRNLSPSLGFMLEFFFI